MSRRGTAPAIGRALQRQRARREREGREASVNLSWSEFLTDAVRGIRTAMESLNPAIIEAGTAFNQIAQALRLSRPEVSRAVLGYAIYINGEQVGVVDRVQFGTTPGGLTVTVGPNRQRPRARWVYDRSGMLVPTEFHRREEELRRATERRQQQERWHAMYHQQLDDGADQEWLRWVASRQASAYEDQWAAIRRMGGRIFDRGRYEAFGENSYDDGSIRQEYIEGEIVDGAQTVTFTEEEKLAVTAKPPGSIKREGRSRRVFEE